MLWEKNRILGESQIRESACITLVMAKIKVQLGDVNRILVAFFL